MPEDPKRPTKPSQIKREAKALDALARVYLGLITKKSTEELLPNEVSIEAIRKALFEEEDISETKVVLPETQREQYEDQLKQMYSWGIDEEKFPYDLSFCSEVILEKNFKSLNELKYFLAAIDTLIRLEGCKLPQAQRLIKLRWNHACSNWAKHCAVMLMVDTLFSSISTDDDRIKYSIQFKQILKKMDKWIIS